MKQIAVIGGSQATTREWTLAYQLGKELAKNKFVLICGGMGGVMEAVCKGAKEIGGLTVGILPGKDPSESNPYVDLKIVTAMSHARNAIVVRSADVVIAIGGEYGTLSEIAHALIINKPVISLKSWKIKNVKYVENITTVLKELKKIFKK